MLKKQFILILPLLDTTMNNTQLLPGIKPVLELLNSKPTMVDTLFIKKGLRTAEANQMLDICRANDIRFSLVDTHVLNGMCKAQHQGVIARLGAVSRVSLAHLWEAVKIAPLPLIIALDSVQDPGNVGTIARTLYALGGAGLILPKHNSAYLGDVAKKAAAGAFEHLPIVTVTNLGHALDEAEEMDIAVLGTGLKAQGESLNALEQIFPLPAVLVLGNEGKGLRPNIVKRCGHMVSIPMLKHFDSLNVAQAGAILMGLVAKQCVNN